MKPLPHTSELHAVAKRTVWFKAPQEALAYPFHFIAHVLTYGTFEDVATLRKYLDNEELVEAIDHAPAGVFDARSWAYWNLKIGRYPTPPMPRRTFGEAE
jgi:hypothetical protein